VRDASAGFRPILDAGVLADGGADGGMLDERGDGCGCRAAGARTQSRRWLLLSLAVVLFLRRKRA
jgi:MYXO-CTERM domain-containing protein